MGVDNAKVSRYGKSKVDGTDVHGFRRNLEVNVNLHGKDNILISISNGDPADHVGVVIMENKRRRHELGDSLIDGSKNCMEVSSVGSKKLKNGENKGLGF